MIGPVLATSAYSAVIFYEVADRLDASISGAGGEVGKEGAFHLRRVRPRRAISGIGVCGRWPRSARRHVRPRCPVVSCWTRRQTLPTHRVPRATTWKT